MNVRNADSMNWYLWEAIVQEARDMHSKGLICDGLMAEFTEVLRSTYDRGIFSLKLRRTACMLEQKLKPYEAQWEDLVRKEQEEYTQLEETNA